MLIDQTKSEDKAKTIIFPNQNTLDSPHHAAPDSHFLASNELRIRLGSLSAKIGSQKLDLRFRQRQRLPPVAHNLKHPRRLQNRGSIMAIDANK
jgi:hypothetical protein